MSCTNGINLTKNSTAYFLEMAARHKKSQRDNLIGQVKQVLEKNPAIIQNKMTKLAREFYLRGREVMGEYHRLNAFIRFELYPEYLLVGEIRHEHDIIDLMFYHFRRRFPEFIILILDQINGYIATKRAKIQFPTFEYKKNFWFFTRKADSLTIVREFIRSQLPKTLQVDLFTSAYWEKYYDSQYIKERKNIRLARKFIPKKMIRKSAGSLAYEAKRLEEEEKKQQKTTLLDFSK